MEAITFEHLLADPASAEPAIISEDPDVTLSRRALADQVERLSRQLRSSGVRTGDAVALVMPNRLDLLMLCLALPMAGLIAAPLNPSYSADELRRLIQGIDACAVVTAAGNQLVAEALAGLATPIWTSSVEPLGEVQLAGLGSATSDLPAAPNADDVALFLQTSGTEGRPKVVPLTHANVLLSARHIAASYALSPSDRSLVAVPLFHGHGLIGAALSTLASGGAVILPPRFSASRFWRSFRRDGATWWSAVPTIHQILLERADTDGAPRTGARFIRSCSAPLAPAVLGALETRFGAPVIEAYGLTEASHQVASNPLPPRPHKSGSVGVGTGVEIAVIDAGGRHLSAGSAGEVVVRGPTVMREYRNDPAATAATFIDGWLRTGDLGALGADGYLTLVGRIKEMINRGGEKISPVEIEAALMTHPAVARAAVFGAPDPKYGEVVEAAVVLKADTDAETLRSYLRERLAEFQIPGDIRFVSHLPVNATGKVNRRALAALYGRAA